MPTRFTLTHLVQFSETDVAGVVHFSNYFRWMEEVEHAFFRSLGMSVHAYRLPREKPDLAHPAGAPGDETIVSWPRIAASCEYRGPARFEDEVTLRLRVARVGAKSFTYEVDFSIQDRRIAKGKVTSVCCVIVPPPAAKFQTIPIPPAIRAKLAGD